MVLVKCLDTYALVEIAKGNPHFSHYFTAEFVITDLTLAEFYGVILREKGKRDADYWATRLGPYSTPVDKKVLLHAVRFRFEHRKQRISFFDAVGYIFSRAQGYAFVTGDKEFKNLQGVEYKK